MSANDFEESSLIHELPYNVLLDICQILNCNNTWEQLALHMPDIASADVDGCRKYESPSWLLLRIWSSKGYTYLHLYCLFAKVRIIRCMVAMQGVIDAKHHYLKESAMKAGGGSNLNYLSVKGQVSATRKDYESTTIHHSKPPASSSNTFTSTSSGANADPLIKLLSQTLSIPYSELQEATDNFSSINRLGAGGYGVVYKGVWKQLTVAVKKIVVKDDSKGNADKERLKQSIQELRTLTKCRHDNILPIYAVSLEGPDPCLVYMYMANGSLEDRLRCKNNTKPLTWNQKVNICVGCAKGLLFLHEMSATPIIHGDVKSANILLDNYLQPKLGDFGLSRDGQIEADGSDVTPLIASHIKGTLAYMPPEFLTNKIISTKFDVFSFGVVLLEVATGLPAYQRNRTPPFLKKLIESELIKASMHPSSSCNRIQNNLMDAKSVVNSENSAIAVSVFDMLMQIGLKCANDDRTLRPSFKEITTNLSEFYSHIFDE